MDFIVLILYSILLNVLNSDMLYLTDMVQSDWEGGYYPMTIHFSENYPFMPPKCKFPQGFFHPNVYPSGKVCLQSLFNQGHVSFCHS